MSATVRATLSWLDQCAAAFGRRGKAIRYHARFALTREVEQDGYDRLNIDVSRGSNSTSMRLSLWSDRTMWFFAGRPGPRRRGGWQYLIEFHGYLDVVQPSEVVSLFEESLLCVDYPKDPNQRFSALLDAWQDVDPVVERSIASSGE